ncbi:hypothetical protein SAMN05216600_105288 [Pseudomonas cuatrocienegasensis]|uniref:Helix-turn-helix domain-containing protein n=1 Tax=Pseudomonas cuatrocienegasensis TaxID=543360 RepID=A0ABY1BAV6_9PSED|nr:MULTISPECIES: hypothetical protein [Pseudomonas]OEC34898.1 hypothetical protein A7D25_11155 [Pseudomonas sp. 21C1]SEQ40073.1 hypothetical protein SAMN05216600_105288 [Pseudomonas cuatrocienegasensis]
MKVEELAPDLFADCPRYLTPQRFAELASLQKQQNMVTQWIDDGALPTRCFGKYRLIDIQTLIQRLNQAQGVQG